MVMLIDGVPAEQLVQKSVLEGLVQRPTCLQPTLDPALQSELAETILAARRRLIERQKREADRHRATAPPPGIIMIDGTPAPVIAQASIRSGLVRPKSRKKILSSAEMQERQEKQKKWAREATQRWREKKRREREAAKAAMNEQPSTPPADAPANSQN